MNRKQRKDRAKGLAAVVKELRYTKIVKLLVDPENHNPIDAVVLNHPGLLSLKRRFFADQHARVTFSINLSDPPEEP